MMRLLLQCPSAEEKSEFIAAVQRGYITWHAGPMNLQIEMAHEPWLFEAGLDISQQLDERFAITRTFRVISQRDVPGLMLCFAFLLLSDATHCYVIDVQIGTCDYCGCCHTDKARLWRFLMNLAVYCSVTVGQFYDC